MDTSLAQPLKAAALPTTAPCLKLCPEEKMRPSRLARCSRTFFVAVSMISLFSVSAAASSREHTIYALPGRPDCGNATSPPIADADGNLYGPGFGGGANNLGCICK